MDATSDSLGSLPDTLAYHKHIPLGIAKPVRRSRSHLIRATAKRMAQDRDPQDLNASRPASCSRRDNFLSPDVWNISPDSLRPILESDLRNDMTWGKDCATWLRREANSRTRGESRKAREAYASHEAEGRDLARSRISLPTDHSRIVRRRSLEREEAFCDANTYKGNVRLRRTAGPSDDAQVAELYSMGLLYDGETRATEPFNLNSIRHEEPVYSIRPAKRARKLNKARGYGSEQALDLDLSFSDLGNDQTIAHYLMSPSYSEAADNSGDEAIQHSSRQPGQSFAPLRVIYELVSSKPSFDVDTSQPPDLVNDIISDYDCFSDSELDDTPSQWEIHDDGSGGGDGDAAAAATDRPADPWVMLG